MRRIALIVEYDGSDFAGWQLQPDARSVQGELEAAFREVTGQEPRVHGAGRTDAGVHATGQAAHVDVDSRLSALELCRALNAVLPADVALRQVREAAPDFDARHDALGKRYVYRILSRATPAPLRRAQSWQLRGRLDLEAMRKAARSLEGTHDFAAFRGAHGGADPEEPTRRSLDRLGIERRSDEIRIVAEGRSFLRYMVRNLVGTLVEVGAGRLPEAAVTEILSSGNRSRAGPTAPAHGLSLEWVQYGSADEAGGSGDRAEASQDG